MSRLGLTQASVMERGGPSDTTLRKILDNEQVGVSTMTLKKLDDAFGWDAGSAAATLAGGRPTVTTEIQGAAGRIRLIHGLDEADQESLELIRLAQIVHDARDVAQSQSGPFMTALAALLDEAAELVTRIVTRVEGDGRENAEWFIEQARANNNIRRQGDVYVIDNNEGESDVDQAAPPRASSEADEGEKTRRGVGRRRTSVRPIHDDQIELPPIEYLAAESGGPKGIPDIPSEAEESQDPDDHRE